MFDLIVWIKESPLNPKIKINSINIVGYASPDGVEDKNSNLSNERTKAARASLISLMKKAKIAGYTDTANYTLQGKGEDFDGFKEQLNGRGSEGTLLIYYCCYYDHRYNK